MLIREIILENFMSYEYARIPLKPGVNLICGPNGAGKSSILLGISVALGQSYTERSKKLSDLIRRGKDVGRVTLVLDNSKVKGRRPAPRINKDQIFLTRVLRRDGKYWFELDNANATRADVLRLLSRFNIDPDNMLIIMHQDMVEQFIVLSPQEKLRLLEAAVGLEPYRRNVVEAQKKLSRILSQEESLSRMLESAEQTLNYWREQYDRYQQKKQLILKRRFLERELAWAEASKREQAVLNLERKVHDKRHELEKTEDAIKLARNDISDLQRKHDGVKKTWQRLFEERLTFEREKARHEFNVSNVEANLRELRQWVEFNEKTTKEFLSTILSSKQKTEMSNPESLKDYALEARWASENFGKWAEMLNLKIRSLEESAKESTNRVAELEVQLADTKNRMQKVSIETEGSERRILERRIDLALLEYQRNEILKELAALDETLKSLRLDIDAAVKRAEEMGPRIVALRSTEEIQDEIRMVDGRIAAQADISGDVERMYESYSKLYFELKDKAQVAAENREKALEEVKIRMDAWRKVIQSLLEHVNHEYETILSQAVAEGSVRLIDQHDIEAAGIEILVGFKGATPVSLSIYSQSGGERSTATMAFLLALQQHIRSPFRAVDEYDVHMDPKNREVIANLLLSVVKGEGAQYLAITPNQALFEGKDAHIITVQNIEGVSLVKEVD